MLTYLCPQCGSKELAVYARCWVNFPEREVLPEDAEEACVLGDEEAVCRSCQHLFKLGIDVPHDANGDDVR